MSMQTRVQQSPTPPSVWGAIVWGVVCLGAVSLCSCADPETVPTESPVNTAGGVQNNAPAGTEVEQQNGRCPSTPEKLTGAGAEGTPCTTPRDCQPVCCNCSGSSKSWLAAACLNGTCAPTSACTSTQNDAQYCQGTPGGPSNGPGDWPGSDDPGSNNDGGQCSTSVPGGATFSDGSSGCNSCLAGECCSKVKECNDDASCKKYGLCMAGCEGKEDEDPLCDWRCASDYTTGKRLFERVESCRDLSCNTECS